GTGGDGGVHDLDPVAVPETVVDVVLPGGGTHVLRDDVVDDRPRPVTVGRRPRRDRLLDRDGRQGHAGLCGVGEVVVLDPGRVGQPARGPAGLRRAGRDDRGSF